MTEEEKGFLGKWEPIIKKQGEEMVARTKPEPNECPRCGRELSEDFDAVDIDIDLQTGFVCLKRKCECGAKLQLFYDYDRTEED